MIHKMKLFEEPFENIKSGIKTVEFRLNDEKRQQIKIGDKIEFSKLPDLEEKIIVQVLDLYKEKTFKQLFKKVYKYITEEEIDNKVKRIYNKIYSPEQEKKYGVLGIKIKSVTN